LKDLEVIKLLDLSQRHLTETKDSFGYAAQLYYFTGGFFLWLALLNKSVSSVFVPDVELIVIEGLQNVITAMEKRKFDAANQPGMTQTGCYLASSMALAFYLLCESLLTLTVGTGTHFRSYHMVNAILCGLVIV
jgi:hypothetical protein